MYRCSVGVGDAWVAVDFVNWAVEWSAKASGVGVCKGPKAFDPYDVKFDQMGFYKLPVL